MVSTRPGVAGCRLRVNHKALRHPSTQRQETSQQGFVCGSSEPPEPKSMPRLASGKLHPVLERPRGPTDDSADAASSTYTAAQQTRLGVDRLGYLVAGGTPRLAAVARLNTAVAVADAAFSGRAATHTQPGDSGEAGGAIMSGKVRPFVCADPPLMIHQLDSLRHVLVRITNTMLRDGVVGTAVVDSCWCCCFSCGWVQYACAVHSYGG